jgi:hypothetical protein
MKKIARTTLSLSTTTLRPLAALTRVAGGLPTIGCTISPSAPPDCVSRLCTLVCPPVIL